MAKIEKIIDGVYRIATLLPDAPITFNQFLIDDEKPTLIHTGMHQLFDDVRKAVAQVLDPARLAYVVVPHFEADECGGMGRFVAGSPQSTLVCSALADMLNFSGWDYSGPVQGMQDGSVLELGERKLRFLETPHVHHWDSMMIVEETSGSLFPADLFIQPGDQPVIVRENLSQIMCQLYREVGIFASEAPVRRVVSRLEKLDLQWIHPMHGGSLSRETAAPYIHALQTEGFAFDGKVFGRPLPG